MFCVPQNMVSLRILTRLCLLWDDCPIRFAQEANTFSNSKILLWIELCKKYFHFRFKPDFHFIFEIKIDVIKLLHTYFFLFSRKTKLVKHNISEPGSIQTNTIDVY